MLYYSNEVFIPVGFEIIKKDILYSDTKTKKVEMCVTSDIKKNKLNLFRS